MAENLRMKKISAAAKAKSASRSVTSSFTRAPSLVVPPLVLPLVPPLVPALVPCPAPRRTNADMSNETQASILKATIASLAEHGYAGTTMAGIAARVGVSRAALVYHFASKNTLTTAVINAIYDEMGSLYLAAAHPALTPQERASASLRTSV